MTLGGGIFPAVFIGVFAASPVLADDDKALEGQRAAGLFRPTMQVPPAGVSAPA